MKKLVLLSLLLSTPAFAQQLSPKEQALAARIMLELNANIDCNTGVIALRNELVAAQARINVNSRQLGCSGNTRQALLSGFETGADFVIAGEDDGIVTADLLEYMTWAAERYRDDKDVMAVCTFQDHPPQDTAEVRRVEWFFPPVWGTWADRFSEVEAGWPRVDSIDWARYLHADCMKPKGQVVIQPMATRSQQIGEYGTYQRGSLQEAWDKQQFTAAIGPQSYREIPGVWTSGGDRLR